MEPMSLVLLALRQTMDAAVLALLPTSLCRPATSLPVRICMPISPPWTTTLPINPLETIPALPFRQGSYSNRWKSQSQQRVRLCIGMTVSSIPVMSAKRFRPPQPIVNSPSSRTADYSGNLITMPVLILFICWWTTGSVTTINCRRQSKPASSGRYSRDGTARVLYSSLLLGTPTIVVVMPRPLALRSHGIRFW